MIFLAAASAYVPSPERFENCTEGQLLRRAPWNELLQPLDAVERPRPGPGPARTSYFLGTTRLAWVYKTRLGLQDLPGSARLACDYKSSLRLKV
jgi:hypothetical protein